MSQFQVSEIVTRENAVSESNDDTEWCRAFDPKICGVWGFRRVVYLLPSTSAKNICLIQNLNIECLNLHNGVKREERASVVIFVAVQPEASKNKAVGVKGMNKIAGLRKRCVKYVEDWKKEQCENRKCLGTEGPCENDIENEAFLASTGTANLCSVWPLAWDDLGKTGK